ncbi:MAG: hypothetical protein ACYC3X_26920 [Pirellulaceae bacterium]
MKRREILELLDGCQADLRDLTEEETRTLVATLEQDSELQDQWQTIQAWDAEIRRVFRDVPVPDGLADRLSAAVAAESPGSPVPPATPNAAMTPHAMTPDSRLPDIEAAREAPLPRVQLARSGRRWWLTRPARLAAGLLATSAVLLFAAWFAHWGLGWGDQLTAQQVAGASLAWTKQLDPEAWQSANWPDADYPLDPSVRLRIVGWQHCSALTDSQAVAYRAELPPARTTALLYVIRTRQGRLLPALPPTVPDSTTGDFCVGVWKNNDCLYVLVVPGGPSGYLRALHQSFAGVTLRGRGALGTLEFLPVLRAAACCG